LLSRSRNYHKKILTEAEKDFERMLKEINDADKLHSGKKSEAEKLIYSTLDNILYKNLMGELDINLLGYQFMSDKKYGTAISIFKYNTEKFPASFNVWDSLGEAYMENGNKKLAIINYKTSLELNPENDNAVRMIEKMKNGSM
jgi:tetratricopeptide (TPR) repeat protein